MDWLLWIVGGLVASGGLGFVALLIFAPALAAVVGKVVADIVASKPGLVALALVAGLFAGDVYRAAVDGSRCDARVAARDADWQRQVDALNAKWRADFDRASAEFAEARKKRDAEVADKLKAANDQRQAELDQADQQWRDQFEAYKARIAAAPKDANGCTITQEDMR